MHTHREIGIYSYLSFSPGIGGKLKKEVEDFYVEEIPISIERNENGKNLFLKIKLRNWETNRFVKILSKELGISRNRIRFSGTKDKRSVSVQYFCIMNYTSHVNLRMRDAEILEEFRSDSCIELGDLLGNRFRLNLRDAECDDRVEKIEDELRGFFPNFFGVQRFGATRPITHIIGRYIIEGKYEEAVRHYIGAPGDFEDDEGRKIFFESMDARESIKEISVKAEYERAMLNHLITREGDYIGALRSLPKSLLMMFVHAYQSYLFNMMVSERIKRGVDVQIGDVVMKTDKHGIPMQSFVKVNSFNYEKIKKLVGEGKAYVSTILFGYESEFTDGIQGEIEREIVEKENIDRKMFRIREIPELSSKGRRRNILAKYWDYHRDGCTFSFSLFPGTYATSLMREFMKREELEYY